MPRSTGFVDDSYEAADFSADAPLDWIAAHLDLFSPFDEEDTYSPSRTKPFIELAIMAAVYVATTGDTASPAVRRAGRLFQAASERADYIDWALRFPAELVNYAELCAAVHEFGADDEELRRRLQSAVDAGAPDQVERLPHRLLELRVALDWAGIRHALPSVADICEQTVLGRPLSVHLLPDSTVYAITHVILFGSRFGTRPQDLPGWLRSAGVRRLLCDLLVTTGQSRNWDLLGELLLCWDCLEFRHNLITTAAWTAFRGARRADGAVPPRPASTADRGSVPTGTAADGVADLADFNRVYHTTLVAVLAETVRSSTSARAYPPPQLVRGHGTRVRGKTDHQSAPALSPEERDSMARGAQAWLASLSNSIPTRGPRAVSSHCQLLVAYWISDTLTRRRPAGPSRFPEVAQRVARALTMRENGESVERVKPTLKLLVEVLLASEGLEVPPLRQFLTRSVDLLLDTDAIEGADPAFMDKRVLLHSAGLLPEPPTPPADVLLSSLKDFRLPAPTAATDALLLRLECMAGWGTRPVDVDAIQPSLRDVLAGFAVQRLRDYDLVEAARLVRLLEYLDAGTGTARRSDLHRGLLCDNRRTHGPFGWFGPEQAKLPRSHRPWEVDAELYLPTTLECLWALAEISPGGWRLFDSLPSYVVPDD